MQQKIFEPINIKNRLIPNRLCAQAMEGNDCENGGQPSERTINRYKQYADGKWGLVHIEATSIIETSLARVNGMIINKKNLDSIKRLVDAFRKYDKESLLIIQITHSGERSGSFSDIVTITPGTLPCNKTGPRYLSTEDIERIRDRFIEGGLLTEQAGIDGIDIKMCHGYLGGEMLRPTNTRDDGWGGSFENRTRFLREIVQGDL